jgi:F-type H+-transporting ATPase subunit epsilon
MLVEILTPEKKIYTGESKGVQMPGVSGSFEILDNFTITGGFVEVINNKATVLVEGAEEV